MKRTEREDAAAVSLLEQIRFNYGTEGAEEFSLRTEEPAPEEALPDGYVRRSPVQPYGPDPKGKRKVLTAVLILCLLAVLLAAAGFLYLRYFRR